MKYDKFNPDYTVDIKIIRENLKSIELGLYRLKNRFKEESFESTSPVFVDCTFTNCTFDGESQ